ncbi:Alpha-galactosidase [Pseudozyma hubeiensis]|nr:Alpha-galactosidase [Pseudozyma hubeiensis]
MSSSNSVFHLRSGGTSVVLDCTAEQAFPTIVYWGAGLGEDATEQSLKNLATVVRPQAVSGGLSQSPQLTLLPQASQGWQGTPGITMVRTSSATFCFDFIVDSVDKKENIVVLHATDKAGAVKVKLTIEVTASGLLSQRCSFTNIGKDHLDIHDANMSFPLPSSAREILDTTGRHLRERHPQRHAFTVGKHVRESRRGRPGADATLLLVAGTPGFGFEQGLVQAVHLAWSGNHRISAERGPSYSSFIQAGELLEPGEISLAPGKTYTTPVALGSWGSGLSELAHRFHQYLRQRSHHPNVPRPITINTWEAVYFDMRIDRLKAIADAAASVGAERFVLDDGWFNGRRDDTAGLGDWFVDKTVWPNGLQPLWDHVDKLGLQCGLWVEPEMVNLNSELGRNHPEWILRPNQSRLPRVGRDQYVLDLSNPGAFDYILKCLDDILTEYPLIKYFKWDHNRDLVEAGGSDGRAAVHNTTNAVYRLMDTLKERHPGLEIESCASGGARVDLGILDRTDRIWTSDCTDPLERLTIQKYTNLLVPNELMGAHMGPAHSHTTGRTHGLHLRAGVALFGHMGMEWDISQIDKAELDQVRHWIDLHKTWRSVIHTGRPVFADLPPETGADLRGVVSQDATKALYTFVQMQTSQTYPPAPVTFPGLDGDRTYTISMVREPETDRASFVGQSDLSWLHAEEPCTLTGQMLATVGVQMPTLLPETLLVFEVVEAPK